MNTKAIANGTITATTNNEDHNGYADTSKGMTIFVNVSAISGLSSTYSIKLQHKDVVSGVYVDTGITSTDLTAAGSLMLRVYPGITAVANADYSMVTPYVWRLVETVGGTTPSITRTVTVTTID